MWLYCDNHFVVYERVDKLFIVRYTSLSNNLIKDNLHRLLLNWTGSGRKKSDQTYEHFTLILFKSHTNIFHNNVRHVFFVLAHMHEHTHVPTMKKHCRLVEKSTELNTHASTRICITTNKPDREGKYCITWIAAAVDDRKTVLVFASEWVHTTTLCVVWCVRITGHVYSSLRSKHLAREFVSRAYSICTTYWPWLNTITDCQSFYTFITTNWQRCTSPICFIFLAGHADCDRQCSLCSVSMPIEATNCNQENI